jgi:hypothetical protein
MTYYNPLMGGPKQAPKVLQIGWGEGLDEAGRFLNNLSDNNEVSAFSWYHIGPFSYYFEGDTVEQSMNERITDETYDLLFDSDYLVIYIHQWQREIPSSILEPLKAYQPLKTIVINNIPYVDIYRVADLDPSDFRP